MLSLSEINTLVQTTILSLQANIKPLLAVVGIATLIQVVNSAMGNRLCVLGIYPRAILSLPGIFFHPWLHGGMGHLFMNAIMFIVMGSLVAVDGIVNFYVVSLSITAISGFLVWLFGRKSLHVGASGLVLGYWGFLIANAYADPQFLTIILGGICIYFFWGLVINLFPTEQGVSWEGHVFGFLAGILTSFYLPELTSIFLHFFPDSGTQSLTQMLSQGDIMPSTSSSTYVYASAPINYNYV